MQQEEEVSNLSNFRILYQYSAMVTHLKMLFASLARLSDAYQD